MFLRFHGQIRPHHAGLAPEVLYAIELDLYLTPIHVEGRIANGTFGDLVTVLTEFERECELCRLDSFDIINEDHRWMPGG